MSPASPRFSRRSQLGDPCPLAKSRMLTAQAHPSPIDLSLTNPAQAHLPQLALEDLLEKDRPPYQAEARGSLRARKSLARAHRHRGPLRADDFLLTSSTSEAYSLLLHTLCDSGDAIFVPAPSYPLFEQLAQLAGTKLIRYPLRYDGVWHIDTAALPSRAELAEMRVRAVFCVSPNNPTGNALRRSEWNALTDLGLPIIVDEVFHAYLSSKAPNSDLLIDPLTHEASQNLTVVLDGLSKRALAPGFKVAWLSARGPGAQTLLSRLEIVADTFLSVSEAAQSALDAALRKESRIQQVVSARLTKNEQTLHEITENSSLTVLQSDGGWMRIVRLPAIQSEREWSTQWAVSGLHLHPGELYGLPFSPSAVLSLLPEPEVFREGVTRLLSVVQSHSTSFPGC